MDKKLPTTEINQNDDEQITPEGEGRRDFMKKIMLGTASAVSVLLVPDEAEATATLIESPGNYSNGYPEMISHHRRSFGTRQDFQQGFSEATVTPNQIFELPGGFYGRFKKDNTNNNIIPNSIYQLSPAGYLHAVQSTKHSLNYSRSHSKIWQTAATKLRKDIRDTIIIKYPEYNRERGGWNNRTWLLDAISNPVVTLKNLPDEQLEMFLRIPTPGGEEFSRLATKEWNDYTDQNKLRHKHAFDTKYNKAQSLYRNLNNFYGPQMQTIRNATQSVKNHVAVSIRRVDQALNNQLSASQKTALNDWLNVNGTRYEI